MPKTWIVLAAALFLATSSSAHAASLTVKFTNMSGDSITQLTATLKDAAEASTQSILESPIASGASGASGEASLEASESDCLFTLTFTFASGKTLDRADTDLCQTDRIVIE
jgi:hypothetical protein